MSARRYVLHAPASERGEGSPLAILRRCGCEPVPAGPGELRERARELWDRADTLVFLFSLPVTVRVAGPLLSDKGTDPAVLCVPEDGSLVLPVAGCHLGGGLDEARELAAALGTEALSTVSSDRLGLIAPDLWARRRGFRIANREALAGTIRGFLETGRLPVWIDPRVEEAAAAGRALLRKERGEPPLGAEAPAAEPGETLLPLPEGWIPAPLGEAAVLLALRPPEGDRRPCLIPPCLVVGAGCRRAAGAEAIGETVRRALAGTEGAVEAVREIRTIRLKGEEPGLVETARRLGVPLIALEEESLRGLEGPFSESAARRRLDLPGVAEPCAASAGRLLAPRTLGEGTTAAVALAPLCLSGSLAVVGTGPGEARFLTGEAREAIRAADAVVGYAPYVDQIPPGMLRGKVVRRFTMGEEEVRVRTALELEARGYAAVLVCGGDPILFGLAGLAHALSPVPVRVIPGISAAQAAGARLGAPYTNGLIQISLSDYLQPWPEVVREMEAAVASGMALACYNPVRRGLEEKLARVRAILAGRTCLLVRDAGRPGESVREVPAEALSEALVDMRTLLFFPPPRARRIGAPGGEALWLDPRGYRSEPRREDREADPAPGGGSSDAAARPSVWVLGGTTEGRAVAETLLAEGYRVRVSLAGETGRATVPAGVEVRVGRLDERGWIEEFRRADRSPGGPVAAVDAAHPFAGEAHRAFARACRAEGIPLARLFRPTPLPEGAIPAASAASAAQSAAEGLAPGETLFLALGVKELPAAVEAARERAHGVRLLARVLPTAESVAAAAAAGLEPREVLAMYGPGDGATNEALFRAHRVRAVVTKLSGGPGGVEAKARAARAVGARLICLLPPEPTEEVPRLDSPAAVPDWVRRNGRARGGERPSRPPAESP